LIDQNLKPNVFVEVWPGEGAPEISILMPIFQQSGYIRDAVYSVLEQRGIVAEIIISDDGSKDETLSRAIQAVDEWLQARGSRHRIVMRRGVDRLWRDHLALLADTAHCDLVCQAHGDDISHPDRGRILLKVFNARPKTALVASECVIIDVNGRLLTNQPRPISNEIALTPVDFDEILRCRNPWLIGFSQAWRRSALADFARLDRNYAATSHDRILPFRAALVGEVFIVRSDLIKRRHHDEAASRLMFDEPETNGRFGWALTRLDALRAMRRDLAQAQALKLISVEKSQELIQKIIQQFAENTTQLLDTHLLQTKANRQISWVDYDTIRQPRESRK
jgi:glycosyltransferase involved in cell wall biosynthesis